MDDESSQRPELGVARALDENLFVTRHPIVTTTSQQLDPVPVNLRLASSSEIPSAFDHSLRNVHPSRSGVRGRLAVTLAPGPWRRTTPPTYGVDWDTVLRVFVRSPLHPSSNWEEELLNLLRTSGPKFQQPDVASISNQPRFRLLGPDNKADKLRTGATDRRCKNLSGSIVSSKRILFRSAMGKSGA